MNKLSMFLMLTSFAAAAFPDFASAGSAPRTYVQCRTFLNDFPMYIMETGETAVSGTTTLYLSKYEMGAEKLIRSLKVTARVEEDGSLSYRADGDQLSVNLEKTIYTRTSWYSPGKFSGKIDGEDFSSRDVACQEFDKP